MTISVVNIGVASTTNTGATVAVTVPAGGVPAAAVIFVGVWEQNNTAGGSVTDSHPNTYTLIQNQVVGGGAASFLTTFYAKNVSALISGNTITFTKQSSGDRTAMTACYLTGVDTVAPLDTTITAKASGSSTTPSVTSAAAVPSTDQAIGFVVDDGGTTGNITQASGWATPPNEENTTTFADTLGGNRAGAGATLTYNPTISPTNDWAVAICAFKASAAAAASLGWKNDWNDNIDVNLLRTIFISH